MHLMTLSRLVNGGFFCTGLNLVHFLGEEFVLIVTSHFYQISRLQFAYFQRVVLGNVLFFSINFR